MPATRTTDDEDDVGSFASCDSQPHSPRADEQETGFAAAAREAGKGTLDEESQRADAGCKSWEVPSSWGADPKTDEPETGGGPGRLAALRSMLPGFRGAAPMQTTPPEEDDDIPEDLRPPTASADAEVSASIACASKEEMPSHWGFPEAEVVEEEIGEAKSHDAPGPLAGFRSALSGLRGGSPPASPGKPPQEVVSDDDDIPESLRPKVISAGTAAEVAQAAEDASEQMPGHWGMADAEEREEDPTPAPNPGRLAGLRMAVATKLAGGSSGTIAASDLAVAAAASAEEMPSQYEVPETQEGVAADVPSHWGMPTQNDDEDKVATPSLAQGIGSRLAGLKSVIPGLGGRSESQQAATPSAKQNVDDDDDDDDIPESIRSKRLSANSEAKAAEALELASEQMPGHWGMAQACSEDDADIIAAAVKNIPSECETQEVSEESAVDVPSHWGMAELPDGEAEVCQTPADEGRLAGLKRAISTRLGGNSDGLRSDEEVAAIMAASAAEELPSQYVAEH